MSDELPRLAPEDTRLLDESDFSIPTLADTGDGSPEILYQWVGIALTRWAEVEDELAAVFAALLGTKSVAAFRAFNVFTSLPAKCKAISAAAEISLSDHPDLASSLGSRLGVVVKANARRNDIAHASVTDFTYRGKKIGCVLLPSIYKRQGVTWKNIEHKYRYNSDIVCDFARKFDLLHKQTFDFARSLETKLIPDNYRPP